MFLDELSPAEAKALLQKLITQSKVTEIHLDRLVALLKGHPLALELAAASLNLAEDSTHIEDILDEYQKGIEEGSPFDAIPLDAQTPRSLNVVFGRSYNTLSDSLKAQFRALGVLAFDAPWDRPLMASVWQVENEKAVRTIHQELRTRALIAHAETIDEAKFGEGWYQQHRLLRTYANALLVQEHEYEDVFVRYADYITVQSAQFDSQPPESWVSFESILAPHLLAVGDKLCVYYYRSESHSAVWTARVLNFAHNVRTYLTNRREIRRDSWLEMGLAAAQARGDVPLQALFLNELGMAWSDLGEQRNALEFFEQALSWTCVKIAIFMPGWCTCGS